MYVPKLCRVALAIDDLAAFEADARALLKLDLVSPLLDEQFTEFSVLFGEHGIMGIRPHVEVPFVSQGKLIEVAIDVEDAPATRALLAASGYEPAVVNHLPEPNADEYLYGKEFAGVPFMVCTRGDNEAQMRVQGPFRELEEAPFPKLASVVLTVEDIERTAADLAHHFGMESTECAPRGLGTRAVTGHHRITLVEGPSELSEHFASPLAALVIAADAVEAMRARLEGADMPVIHSCSLRTGGTAYYFGSAFHGIPLLIHPATADGEMISAQAATETAD